MYVYFKSFELIEVQSLVRQKYLQKKIPDILFYTMEPRQVPNDLFPINVTELEKPNWASATYHYWSAFSVGHKPNVPSSEDLGKWKLAAADIMEELKSLGVRKAHAKIVDMMKNYYKFEHGRKNFTSVYDVADVLSNRDLYEKNKALYRDMFYMFQYGIFRVGFNGWALDAATEWMEHKNICYESNSIGRTGRKGKGCIYKLIVTRASNSICDHFQHLTQRRYDEYIVVRDKKLKKYGDHYELKPYTFNHRFLGYLCTASKTHKASNNMSDVEMKRIQTLYTAAKHKGISFESFYGVMEQMINNNSLNGKTIKMLNPE